MKKVIFAIIGLAFAAQAMSQTEDTITIPARIVDSTAKNQKLVLEHFCGTFANQTPPAQLCAKNYASIRSDNVFVINYFAGGYAPTLQTAVGNALATENGFSNVYPAAMLNRNILDADSNTITTDTAIWKSGGDMLLVTNSFVNVAATASVNVNSGLISVHVETFYTAAAPTNDNKICIAVMQNNIATKQKGAEMNSAQLTADGYYIQNDVFRYLMEHTIYIMQESEDTTSDETVIVYPTEAGTFTTWDTIYLLPASYSDGTTSVKTDLSDMYLLVYVMNNTTKTIYTATKVDLTYTYLAATPTFATVDAQLKKEIGCKTTAQPVITIRNIYDSVVTSMDIKYGTDTMHWTGLMNPMDKAVLTFPSINIEDGSAHFNMSVFKVNGDTLINEGTYFEANASLNEPMQIEGSGIPYLILKTDRWKSEVSWKVYDNTWHLLQSGGGYEDYSNAPANADTILLNGIVSTGCFIFEINDSYWDGINNENGEGFYKIIDGSGNVLISSNGKFGAGEQKDFKIKSLSGLNSNIDGAVSEINIYPNPAQNTATLHIQLSSNTNTLITITDILGREVMRVDKKLLKSGDNTIDINTANINNGVYFVNVSTDGSNVTKKLIIKH
ncbi:MAG: T9SS type A sorting domain-containing protein [Bacteroidales bacterium]|nr:T9SS type A sorting domain-containing protein [Bacteroidales bacterium]